MHKNTISANDNFSFNCTVNCLLNDCRSAFRPAITILIATLLCACEAKLNLSGVEQTLSQSTLRTDQYQTLVTVANSTVILGSRGLVLVSTDDGEHWQRQLVAEQANFVSADVCPDDSLIALSFDKNLWRSSDKAQTWTSQKIPTREDLQTVHCAPDGKIWLSGSFTTLLSSADQGKNWTELSLNEDALLTHVQFFSEEEGVTAGEFGVFFKTSDGGLSWQRGGTIGEEFYPIDAWFQNQQRGWAVGLNGVIFNTIDGGDSWSRQETGSLSAPLYQVFGDAQQVFAIGDHGTVLRLQGEHWAELPAPKIPVHYSTGKILDGGDLLLAGGWGTINRISNKNAQTDGVSGL